MPAKKGKKNTKFGRNAVKCAAYRTRSTTNKLRKIRKHLRRHPHDTCAITALETSLRKGVN